MGHFFVTRPDPIRVSRDPTRPDPARLEPAVTRPDPIRGLTRPVSNTDQKQNQIEFVSILI